MNMEMEHGKVYKIWHKRKGPFVAQFLGIVEGDEVDPQFIYVRYDVRVGTDQAHLSTNPGKQNVRESNLRPSLITNIELFTDNHWLRELKSPEPPIPTPAPVKTGFLARLKSAFGHKEQ
jgi:hypothetical protein